MAMVSIGCKLPHGLQIAVDNDPRRLTLRGANAPGAAFGCGFTLVDEAFFDAWAAQVTPEFGPLKGGQIFKQPTAEKAKGEAKSRRKETTGFEQAEPAKEGVEPTDEMKATLNEARDDGTGGE